MSAALPRVLIVDDQAAGIHVLAEALTGLCEILVATTCERALELASNADLILLDILMPGMGGLEVCRRLHSMDETREIPVIFVTSLESAEDETVGLEAGAVDYVVKPIHPAVVRARVRAHLELKIARDTLRRLATEDPLTGLMNRRRFDAELDREWRRAARTGSKLTLGFADIDHFKSINDRYGHASGDLCLKHVATALAQICRRPGESIARYGGEEFVVLLPDVNIEGARHFAERALLAIRRAGSPLENREIGLSFGFATLSPHGGTTPEQALAIADEGLYAAKRGGRGRAVLKDIDSSTSLEVTGSSHLNGDPS